MTPDFRAWVGALDCEAAENLEFTVSDDYNLLRERPTDGVCIARGPRFVFDAALVLNRLVEVPLNATFTYECWMLATQSYGRSTIVKTVAQIAKDVSRRES